MDSDGVLKTVSVVISALALAVGATQLGLHGQNRVLPFDTAAVTRSRLESLLDNPTLFA